MMDILLKGFLATNIKAKSGEVFFGRTNGTNGRTADKKRRKNFVLGSPAEVAGKITFVCSC